MCVCHREQFVWMESGEFACQYTHSSACSCENTEHAFPFSSENHFSIVICSRYFDYYYYLASYVCGVATRTQHVKSRLIVSHFIEHRCIDSIEYSMSNTNPHTHVIHSDMHQMAVNRLISKVDTQRRNVVFCVYWSVVAFHWRIHYVAYDVQVNIWNHFTQYCIRSKWSRLLFWLTTATQCMGGGHKGDGESKTNNNE